MIDLSLVSFDEISEELKKRFNAFIFHGVKNLTNEEDQFLADYQGGKAHCIGLCEILKTKIMNIGLEEMENLPPGEK